MFSCFFFAFVCNEDDEDDSGNCDDNREFGKQHHFGHHIGREHHFRKMTSLKVLVSNNEAFQKGLRR